MAVTVAVGAFAFTPRKVHSSSMLFIYTPVDAGDYSETSVKNPTNWTFTNVDIGCGGFNKRACQIEVAQNYYNPITKTMNTTGGNAVVIDVYQAAGNPGCYYVNPTGGVGVWDATNKF